MGVWSRKVGGIIEGRVNGNGLADTQGAVGLDLRHMQNSADHGCNDYFSFPTPMTQTVGGVNLNEFLSHAYGCTAQRPNRATASHDPRPRPYLPTIVAMSLRPRATGRLPSAPPILSHHQSPPNHAYYPKPSRIFSDIP